MALAITRTLGTSGIPVWQGIGKDIQLAQGGFALDLTGLTPGALLPAGSLVVFDEAARTATVTPTATLQAAATGSPTTYRVNKGSGIKVGTNIAQPGAGGAAYPVTAIDTTNSAYDLLTVGTTIGNAAVGAPIYGSTATGASASAYAAANGLLYDDTIANAGESVSVVIRGTIYARRMPGGYSAGIAALTGLKNIIFSQSK
jgi:hypothetical protein